MTLGWGENYPTAEITTIHFDYARREYYLLEHTLIPVFRYIKMNL